MKVTSSSDRAGRMTVAIALAMMMLTIFAGYLDERTLGGVSVWSKPTKFNFSFAVHIATLMVFLTFLQTDFRGLGQGGWRRYDGSGEEVCRVCTSNVEVHEEPGKALYGSEERLANSRSDLQLGIVENCRSN